MTSALTDEVYDVIELPAIYPAVYDGWISEVYPRRQGEPSKPSPTGSIRPSVVPARRVSPRE